MNSSILEVISVSKRYALGDDYFTALEDIELSLEEGNFACMVGPSGCGKSTLLRIMAGLVKPCEGTVKFHGEVLPRPHPKISMVFQNFALLPWKTVLENVELGLKLRGMERKARRKIGLHYTREMGLQGFENNYPAELSGGMKQRVGLARALAIEPEVILLDEPFSALDEITAMRLRKEVSRIWREIGETFLMVTHNVNEALELGKQIVVISQRPGRVREVVDVEMGWPRRAESSEFQEYKLRLLNLLEEEFGTLYNMEA